MRGLMQAKNHRGAFASPPRSPLAARLIANREDTVATAPAFVAPPGIHLKGMAPATLLIIPLSS
jgi:hypothetical protein